MITKCVISDKNQILSYIGSDYASCLYLYLDLVKYGIDSGIIDVYIQTTSNKVEAVLLKYYSCLHVYSRGNKFDAEELATFFLDNKYTILYCPAETAGRIYDAFPDKTKKQVIITEGWVAQIKNVDRKPKGLSILAAKEDFEQIVRLIYEDDDIGRAYKIEELSKQLEERNKEGYARNLVIKKDDLVIAHACTNAEIGNIAVVAELLVRKEYRKQGYASEIWRDICGKLISEGKEVYSFYYSEESRRLHKHIGFDEICEWGKIVIEE